MLQRIQRLFKRQSTPAWEPPREDSQWIGAGYLAEFYQCDVNDAYALIVRMGFARAEQVCQYAQAHGVTLGEAERRVMKERG